jgi:hypothetical protein
MNRFEMLVERSIIADGLVAAPEAIVAVRGARRTWLRARR